jgi:hypothetical protein
VQDDKADRLALQAGDERLAPAAHGHALDLVRREVVQELGPIRAGHLDPQPARAIDQPGYRVDRMWLPDSVHFSPLPKKFHSVPIFNIQFLNFQYKRKNALMNHR